MRPAAGVEAEPVVPRGQRLRPQSRDSPVGIRRPGILLEPEALQYPADRRLLRPVSGRADRAGDEEALARWGEDGRIIEENLFYDLGAFMQQIGLGG